jgi:hypothetical protein
VTRLLTVIIVALATDVAAAEEPPTAAAPTQTSPAVAQDANSPGDADQSTAKEGLAPEGVLAARRLDWLVVPISAYNTDNGLGFGLRAELSWKEPDYEPYRTAFMIQGYASLANFHKHMIRWDRLGLGGDRRLRLTINGVYRQWMNDGYWGIGNDRLRMRAYTGNFDTEDDRRKRYQYQLIQPFLQATLRVDVAERWVSFFSLTGKWSQIGTYADSLLEEEQPFGMEGGLNIQLALGVIYDSREPEIDTLHGLFAEATVFGSVMTDLGQGRFAGFFTSLCGYRALTSWLVVAGRIMAEMMFGEVPFYEMVHWHGALPVAGFGGSWAVRGIPFGRWRGPHKTVGNVEARFRLIKHPLFGRSVVWQLGLFGDGGLVWGAPNEESTPDPPPPYPFHLTGGVGIRVSYADSFVGRLDTAVGSDYVLEPNGRVTAVASYGIYAAFGHIF